jgi:transcriptional regulator with XRE-family HTH domain
MVHALIGFRKRGFNFAAKFRRLSETQLSVLPDFSQTHGRFIPLWSKDCNIILTDMVVVMCDQTGQNVSKVAEDTRLSFEFIYCQPEPKLMTTAEPFGTWLKRKRLERKLTLEALAEMLNTTPTTLSRYEVGARSVPFDVALQFAEPFDVTTKEITAAWISANGGPELPELTHDPDPELVKIGHLAERIPTKKRDLWISMGELLADDAIGGTERNQERLKESEEEDVKGDET